MLRRTPRPPLFPYTTLFRSPDDPPRPAPGRGRLLPGGELGAGLGGGGAGPVQVAAVFGVGPVRGRHEPQGRRRDADQDRKSTRLNSSHTVISYAVFCLKKKK